MKRIFQIILAAAIMWAAPAHAADKKVIEKSASKVPEWVAGFEEGFLNLYVEAPTLNEAQRLAEQELSSRIISAVARNISVKSSGSTTNTDHNGQVDTTEEFSYVSAINSANLPFLKGISLANAADVFWQKVRMKSTGKEYYEYNVKYPFSKSELQTLIRQFEEYDSARQQEYDALERGLNHIEEASEIKQATDALDALETYFFDDVRKSKARSLKASYKSLYKTIAMQGDAEGPGKLRISFTIQGRPLKLSGRISVTANCANKIRTSPDRGGYLITYSTEDCIPDEDNYIEVGIRVESAKLSGRYPVE